MEVPETEPMEEPETAMEEAIREEAAKEAMAEIREEAEKEALETLGDVRSLNWEEAVEKLEEAEKEAATLAARAAKRRRTATAEELAEENRRLWAERALWMQELLQWQEKTKTKLIAAKAHVDRCINETAESWKEHWQREHEMFKRECDYSASLEEYNMSLSRHKECLEGRVHTLRLENTALEAQVQVQKEALDLGRHVRGP